MNSKRAAVPRASGAFFVLQAADGGGSWQESPEASTICPAFEVSSKRRKSFPSETQVKRGDRVVHGDVELIEKLGRNDPCPCGSGRRFQTLLHG
ncbi:SEC-C metal-binding domain-containing protein [Hyphomicrobium sp.]|uniref:SEC-C metal-binding domain-containing protein n=1 Tax=Hyphomicrobium sp. TaxID=82 RepID=UPI000F9F2C63|nr:SEC-C metal-binding domain-containing protein [Hyphomicrobium sp.]RUP07827.1 MAG: hypothetical protein EKK38_16885 [Hyphomicrobium sp.]